MSFSVYLSKLLLDPPSSEIKEDLERTFNLIIKQASIEMGIPERYSTSGKKRIKEETGSYER